MKAAWVATYREQGFACPAGAVPAELAERARLGVESLLAGRRALAPHQRLNSHLLHPWAAELATAPSLLDAVEQVLGPDVLLWRSVVFAKPPADAGYVGWHQDAAYWGLDGDAVATAWVALTPSHPGNGCLRVLVGSHRVASREHVARVDARNLLLRGQQIEGELDLGAARDAQLSPGEFSLHHVAAVHGSGPNPSPSWRIGIALRFVAAHVRPRRRDVAVLVRGSARGQAFRLTELPGRGRDAAARAAHARTLRDYAWDVARDVVRGSWRQALPLAWRLARRPGTLSALGHALGRKRSSS